MFSSVFSEEEQWENLFPQIPPPREKYWDKLSVGCQVTDLTVAWPPFLWLHHINLYFNADVLNPASQNMLLFGYRIFKAMIRYNKTCRSIPIWMVSLYRENGAQIYRGGEACTRGKKCLLPWRELKRNHPTEPWSWTSRLYYDEKNHFCCRRHMSQQLRQINTLSTGLFHFQNIHELTIENSSVFPWTQ